MRFSRLRLLGFKSFVEPGEFVIERGLTGIVGPNGCGKSNLVEALRWVMGESSYKNMRASGMDDVIFSGSGTRPARNTAEVTLFLDNSDRTAPAAFNDADELQVSRRIEREAGSIYRINGKEARAKDVQLLFADQSTGARSPSMVGQGRIGELIQAKPQARRALLEEAAGISGLHTRRHEAELRLRAAEQNLERLDDVVGELESQMESLKRQARQATRFKNLSADIRKAEATLFHLRWTLAKAHEAEAQSALAAATTLVGERAAAQMNAAKDQAVGAHRLPELREAEAAAAAAFQRLSIAKAQIEEEAGRIRARHAELDRRLEQFDADIAREEQMVRDNADILQRLTSEEAGLREESLSAAEREASTRAAFEKAATVLTLSEAAARQADRRTRRGGCRAQPVRACVARDRRAARTAGAPARGGGARGRRHRCKDRRRSPILPKKRSWRRGGPGRAWSRREAAAAFAEKAVAEARAGRERRPPAIAGGQGRTGADRDRGANAGEDLECRRRPTCFRRCWKQISVERGFETALGAALGEDLDAALDASAPVYWARDGRACRRSGAAGGRAQPGVGRARAAPACPAPWRRSASSTPPMAGGYRCCWRPASGWSPAMARCGAGTVSRQAPTRRRPRRSAWRRRTGWRNSTLKRWRRG